MTSLNPAAARLVPAPSSRPGVLPRPADAPTAEPSRPEPSNGSRPVRSRTPRTWQWSRLLLGAAALAAVVTIVGATDPLHAKYVDLFFGATEFWASVTVALLLLVFLTMPLHLLNRLALIALVLVPLAVGLLAVRPHLAPRQQLELVTGSAGIDAVALTDPVEHRVALATQGDRAGWPSDLTSRRFTVACLDTPTASERLAYLSWSSPTTLLVRRFDGRAATISIDSSGRGTALADPQHILHRPGRFGC